MSVNANLPLTELAAEPFGQPMEAREWVEPWLYSAREASDAQRYEIGQAM